jgi:hypothetical protein
MLAYLAFKNNPVRVIISRGSVYPTQEVSGARLMSCHCSLVVTWEQVMMLFHSLNSLVVTRYLQLISYLLYSVNDHFVSSDSELFSKNTLAYYTNA